MKDLKERTLRGGAAKVIAQAANFILRIGSLMVLARLLDPKEFGLIGMVTAVIGVLNLFRDFGLSTAAVQRATISEEQISTLFWLNILVGAVLTILSLAIAPLVASFYHEPKLLWITAVLASGFLVNAAGVQHGAILQRQMRFVALAVIDILALVVSTAVGVVMAFRGWGYWALVSMTLVGTGISTGCVWLTTRWIPGRPIKHVELHSIVRFGGTVTLNSVVVYIAYNFEKVLLGRYWGAEAVGIYGRAYQLSNIPTENLNSSIGGLAFSALSRVQDDAGRLRNYFLKGYSLVLTLTLPITVLCAVFANDLIVVLLGPKWREAAVIFRLLAPTILIFAMINPFSWLLFSVGKVGRSLKIALVIAPLVITGYIVGLPHGPKGVALAYSVAMTLWVIPHIAWCVRGTVISFWDVLQTLSRPLVSAVAAAVLPVALLAFYGPSLSPLMRLVVGATSFVAAYCGMLLYVLGQKNFYLDLVRGIMKRPSAEDEALALA